MARYTEEKSLKPWDLLSCVFLVLFTFVVLVLVYLCCHGSGYLRCLGSVYLCCHSFVHLCCHGSVYLCCLSIVYLYCSGFVVMLLFTFVVCHMEGIQASLRQQACQVPLGQCWTRNCPFCNLGAVRFLQYTLFLFQLPNRNELCQSPEYRK